jgi:hypothetical protein
LYSRCSIGNLSEEEFGYFKQKCGIEEDRHIEYGYELVLQSEHQIPLHSLEEKMTHQKLLEQFDDDCRNHAPYTWELECCFLCEYKKIADKIIKAREHGDVSTSAGVPQSPDVVNSESAPEPKVEPVDEEDVADKVARLLQEEKGQWVEPIVILDKMKKDYPRRYQKIKTAKRALQRLRESKHIKTWSKKNHKIGIDKAGNIFKQSGEGSKQSIRYKYFLENDAITPSTSHPAPPLQ